MFLPPVKDLTMRVHTNDLSESFPPINGYHIVMTRTNTVFLCEATRPDDKDYLAVTLSYTMSAETANNEEGDDYDTFVGLYDQMKRILPYC
jgi:hypothetical protein